MIFFTKNPNKKNWGGGGAGGARGVGSGEGLGGRWMDRRTGPKQFAPFGLGGGGGGRLVGGGLE